MLKHETVASVGVIGKPDEERTEIVKAYVLLKNGISAGEDIRASTAAAVFDVSPLLVNPEQRRISSGSARRSKLGGFFFIFNVF